MYKLTLLLLTSCTLHAMNPEISTSDSENVSTPLIVQFDSPDNTNSYTHFLNTQESEPQTIIPVQKNSKKNCLKRIAICSSMVTCMVVSTIGLGYVYNNVSNQVSTMKTSCNECTDRLDDCTNRLENTAALITQAQNILSILTDIGPTLAEVKNMSNILRPFLTIFSSCQTDPQHIAAALGALCEKR